MADEEWKVSQAEDAGQLTAPAGYKMSVILKEVEHSTVPPKHTFIIWVLAGRYGASAATVAWDLNGQFGVRIDVPDHATFTVPALEKQLKLWFPNSGHLPDDTPVIRH